MAGPTEFSLEAVRQYMLGRDGQVNYIYFFTTIIGIMFYIYPII